MSKIYNCWQCKYYSAGDRRCNALDIVAVLPHDAICERFQLVGNKPEKKRVLASSRVQLIAKEIEWIRLDPQMHDQMFYDALSTCEQMLRHIAASVKNSERDFYIDTVEVKKHG